MQDSSVFKAMLLLLALCLPCLGDGAKPSTEIDVTKMANDFAKAREQAKQRQDHLMGVLVSFSMPPETLERLAKNAAIAEVPLFLRGLAGNSMEQTAGLIRSVDPQAKANWLVDPRPYREFSVQGVPVFFIAIGGEHELVRGDVSLEYAMRRIAGNDGIAADAARRVLEKLEASR